MFSALVVKVLNDAGTVNRYTLRFLGGVFFLHFDVSLDAVPPSSPPPPSPPSPLSSSEQWTGLRVVDVSGQIYDVLTEANGLVRLNSSGVQLTIICSARAPDTLFLLLAFFYTFTGIKS